MPKIPTYTQQVGRSAGQLSPRASSGAFEQVGQAYAKLGQAVQDTAKVAAQFEKARQEAEVDSIVEEYSASMRDSYNELNSQPVMNVDDYRSAEATLRQGILDGVKGMDKLGSAQKRLLESKLSSAASVYANEGERLAFGRFLGAASETANKKGSSIITQAATNTLPLDVALSEYEDLYTKSVSRGYSMEYTPEQAKYQIFAESLNLMALDESKTLESLTNERELILRGEGVYQGMSLNERTNLSSILNAKVNYLQGGAISELKERADGVMTAIKLNKPGFRKELASVLADARKYGQFDLANNLENNAVGLGRAMVYFNDADLKSFDDMNAARDVLVQQRDSAEVGSDLAQAQAALDQFDDMTRIRKQALADDPGGYITASYQRLHGKDITRTELLRLQKSMGVERVPFTNAEFSSFQSQLAEANAVESLELINNFFGGFAEGEVRSAALGAAMKRGMSATQNIAYFAGSDPRALDLLNASKIDDSLLKETFKNAGGDDEVMQKLITSELRDWSSSIAGGIADGRLDQTSTAGRIESIFEIQTAVSKLAKTYVTQGMSAKAAAKRAAEMITTRYVFEDYNGGTIRMPAIIGPESTDAVRYLEGELRKEDFLAGVVAPPDAVGAAFGATEAVRSETYASEIISGGRWVTSNDDSGVYLVDPLGNIVMQEVVSDGVIKEAPITISFTDIVDGATATRQARVEAKQQTLPGARLPQAEPKQGEGIAAGQYMTRGQAEKKIRGE